MSEEGKKISFGFAKSIKKPILDKPKLNEEKKVDYIECLDEKAIKVIGKKEDKEEPLVIPLLESNTWYDRIINRLDASKSKSNDDTVKNKDESKKTTNGKSKDVSFFNKQIKTDSSMESKTLTLDEQAAKEIIQDLKAIEKNENDMCDITLSLVKGQNLNDAEESTLEDYEKVPLDIFGSAMLRGMGWKPGEGIGKNPKLVSPIVPELRPMGMGLGADKLVVQKQNRKTQKEEELQIKKGSFIKIIAGKWSNAYGQIEGFDDAGRLIVKMALSGNIVSVNECIAQAVTKSEFSKNSKVLNAAKCEEYKNKDDAPKPKSALLVNLDSDNSDSDVLDKKKRHKENDYERGSRSKKSKTERRNCSDNESDSGSNNDNRKKNKSRRRSNSNDRIKKTNKSKKHKGRDKERERRKHKTLGSFESVDKRKSKKHRSRSSSRR